MKRKLVLINETTAAPRRLSRPCPTCDAQPGENCREQRSNDRRLMSRPHAGR